MRRHKMFYHIIFCVAFAVLAWAVYMCCLRHTGSTPLEICQFLVYNAWMDRCKKCGQRWAVCWYRTVRIPVCIGTATPEFIGLAVARLLRGEASAPNPKMFTIGDFFILQVPNFPDRFVGWYRSEYLRGPRCSVAFCKHHHCGLPPALRDVSYREPGTTIHNAASLGLSTVRKEGPNYLSIWEHMWSHKQLGPIGWPLLRDEFGRFVLAASGGKAKVQLFTVHLFPRSAFHTLHLHCVFGNALLFELANLWFGHAMRVDDLMRHASRPSHMPPIGVCHETIDARLRSQFHLGPYLLTKNWKFQKDLLGRMAYAFDVLDDTDIASGWPTARMARRMLAEEDYREGLDPELRALVAAIFAGSNSRKRIVRDQVRAVHQYPTGTFPPFKPVTPEKAAVMNLPSAETIHSALEKRTCTLRVIKERLWCYLPEGTVPELPDERFLLVGHGAFDQDKHGAYNNKPISGVNIIPVLQENYSFDHPPLAEIVTVHVVVPPKFMRDILGDTLLGDNTLARERVIPLVVHSVAREPVRWMGG